MKKYIFGGIKTSVNITDKYFETIAREYEAEFEKADIAINITRTPTIQSPCEQVIGKSFCSGTELYWCDDGGYVMYGYNPPTEEYVFRARTYKDFKTVTAEIADFVTGEYVIRNFLDMVMRFMVIPHGGINIHSSAIAYNGGGLLFSAPSGTGKSTHTALWVKHRPGACIVNDDMPLIKIDKNITLCATPWAGTSGINTNISVPLKAVIFLRRGEENTLTRLNAAQSAGLLYEGLYKTPVKEIALMQLDLADSLLSRVPAYILSCNMNPDAVDVSEKALQSDFCNI